MCGSGLGWLYLLGCREASSCTDGETEAQSESSRERVLRANEIDGCFGQMMTYDGAVTSQH